MWLAQFVSNIGGWMQTVGAQWLMLTLTGSAAYVAVVQTAASLPVMLFAAAAGAVGDLVDRRLLLLITQTVMLAAAALLGALTLAGLLTPWLLLALTFGLGAGQAMTSPTWQTLQPELVPPVQRQQAISLGSVNMNLARAVGPAIGGAVLAATSAGSVFLLNGASFLAVIAVLLWWRDTRDRASRLPREHLGEAVRAGGRFVVASPALRVILGRTAGFVLFAAAVWALLPVAAKITLHVGSGGYGLLLGCVGLGAVAGAALLPRLRTRMGPDALFGIGSATLAGVALVLGFVHQLWIVAVVLVFGGLAWIQALSTLSSLYQLTLPGWVKARGMAYYLIVFQGGTAIGSALLGLAAEHLGLRTTFTASAVALALGPAAARFAPFREFTHAELLPSGEWPQPELSADDTPHGPVMVTVHYRARSGHLPELLAALAATRLARRRTGAVDWRLWQDAADPDRVVEQFVVASWPEHLRQHDRVTQRDQDKLNRVRACVNPDEPVVVTHWLTPPSA